MKTTIYITGAIVTVLIWLASMFKALHFPGANLGFICGMVMLCAFFLPVAITNSFRTEKRYTWLYISLFISAFVSFISALFKIMHWPYSGTLLIIGLPLPFVFFLPIYLYHTLRENDQSVGKYATVIFFMVFFAVESSMLAVNVSREIIDNSLSLNQSIGTSVSYFDKQNAIYLKQVDSSKLESAQQITKLTTQLTDYMKQAKIQLLIAVNEANKAAITSENTIDWNKIKGLDDRSSAELYFCFPETKYGANNLYRLLVDYKTKVLKVTENAPSEKIDFLKTVLIQEDTNYELWLRNNFDEMPLVGIMNTLELMQQQVKIAENASLKLL